MYTGFDIFTSNIIDYSKYTNYFRDLFSRGKRDEAIVVIFKNVFRFWMFSLDFIWVYKNS